MPFLPAFVLMAQTAQMGSAEFPVHYRRPSAVIASAKGVTATLLAFDDRGTIGIQGTPAEIERAKGYFKLVDVPRKPLLVRVTVTSPVDHLTWEVDARLTSGQRWKTSDDETDSEVALEPLAAEDGTLTVKVLARSRGVELTSTLRLAKGSSRTLALGKRIFENVQLDDRSTVSAIVESGIPLLTVTVRYVGG